MAYEIRTRRVSAAQIRHRFENLHDIGLLTRSTVSTCCSNLHLINRVAAGGAGPYPAADAASQPLFGNTVNPPVSRNANERAEKRVCRVSETPRPTSGELGRDSDASKQGYPGASPSPIAPTLNAADTFCRRQSWFDRIMTRVRQSIREFSHRLVEMEHIFGRLAEHACNP
jgi:hypothetical protein